MAPLGEYGVEHEGSLEDDAVYTLFDTTYNISRRRNFTFLRLRAILIDRLEGHHEKSCFLLFNRHAQRQRPGQ